MQTRHNVVVAVVAVLALTHRYNAIRYDRTGSNNWSGRLPWEREKKKKEKKKNVRLLYARHITY